MFNAKNERRYCILISHEKTGRWHSSVCYHYSGIAQPGSTALIMESFLGVSNALWVYVNSLLFLSNVVRFCVTVFLKKDHIKPKGDVSKHCKMIPFSDIAVYCIPVSLSTAYGTEISPAVVYGRSAPLTV